MLDILLFARYLLCVIERLLDNIIIHSSWTETQVCYCVGAAVPAAGSFTLSTLSASARKIISFGSQQMIQRILSHSKKSSLYAIWSSVALLLGREHVEFSAELKTNSNQSGEWELQ